jgi:Tfp pilus assembly protein PilE
MRIFRHGSDDQDGFILIDAVLCVFIAGIMVAAVYGAVSAGVRVSERMTETASSIIEERNADLLERSKAD